MMRSLMYFATAIVSVGLGSIADAQTGQSRTTPVTIVGTATVKDADNPGRHPFQASLCVPLGDVNCSQPTSLSVAPGVRLVIEFVSAECLVNGTAPTVLGIGLKTTVNEVSVQHYLSSLNSVTSGASQARGTISQSTQLYADPETNVSPFLVPTPGWTNGFCSMAVSGHTITP
jgi:hypothetical protein